MIQRNFRIGLVVPLTLGLHAQFAMLTRAFRISPLSICVALPYDGLAFRVHWPSDSSRRSSCLRSSNRSVRKSLPSQVNRSNAKKHGGLPRRNSRFLNCGLPRLSSEQISPSMTALIFSRESEIDSASAEKEANGCPLRDGN